MHSLATRYREVMPLMVGPCRQEAKEPKRADLDCIGFGGRDHQPDDLVVPDVNS